MDHRDHRVENHLDHLIHLWDSHFQASHWSGYHCRLASRCLGSHHCPVQMSRQVQVWDWRQNQRGLFPLVASHSSPASTSPRDHRRRLKEIVCAIARALFVACFVYVGVAKEGERVCVLSPISVRAGVCGVCMC